MHSNARRNCNKWLVSFTCNVERRGGFSTLGIFYQLSASLAVTTPLFPGVSFLSVTTGPFLPSSQPIQSSLLEAVPAWHIRLVTLHAEIWEKIVSPFKEKIIWLYYKQKRKRILILNELRSNNTLLNLQGLGNSFIIVSDNLTSSWVCLNKTAVVGVVVALMTSLCIVIKLGVTPPPLCTKHSSVPPTTLKTH